MSKILISYRREDSTDVTGRIYDRLIQQFGQGAVFKDVDSIPFGVDFRTYLDAQVAKCEVFLAVIGRDWMKKRGSTRKSRLDDPGDFVRIEIESALKRQIPVIPVLVRGASIPPAKQLPASLQDLTYRNGIAVRSGHDFHQDMNRLIESLKQNIQGPKEHRTEPVSLSVEPLRIATPTDMVKMPKGPFLYGEKRVHETVDHDYWIDKYPVTNEQYRAFILADGYGKQAYWLSEGWKWKTKIMYKFQNIGMTGNGTRQIALSWESAGTKRRPMPNGQGSACRLSGSGKKPDAARMGVSIPGGTGSTRTNATAATH